LGLVALAPELPELRPYESLRHGRVLQSYSTAAFFENIQHSNSKRNGPVQVGLLIEQEKTPNSA
jgi:hypothetical protein